MTAHSHTKTPVTVPISSTTGAASASPVVTPVATPPTSTSAASTNSSALVLSTTPPVVDMPLPPTGYQSVILAAYRGYHPSTAQVTAAPDAIVEVASSTTFSKDLGPAAPEQTTFAVTLGNAVGWTTLRAQTESFLDYVKSQEAIVWKSALMDVDQAKAAYDLALTRDASLPATYPALTRLLDAKSAVARKAAATRKKKAATTASDNAAALARATTPSTSTPAAPAATSPSTPTSTPTNGGVAH